MTLPSLKFPTIGYSTKKKEKKPTSSLVVDYPEWQPETPGLKSLKAMGSSPPISSVTKNLINDVLYGSGDMLDSGVSGYLQSTLEGVKKGTVSKVALIPTQISQYDGGGEVIGNQPPSFWQKTNIIVNEIGKLPEYVAAKVITAIKGEEGADVVDKNWTNRFVKDLKEDREKAMIEMYKKYGTTEIFKGIELEDIKDYVDSLSYSITSATGGVAVGLTSGLLSPAVGWVAGGATSGKIAYEMTSYELMQEFLEIKDEQMRKVAGRGLTLKEQQTLKDSFSYLAKKNGLYEAIPEAAGQVFTAGVLVGPLTKMFGSSMTLKILGGTAEMFGGELATETITQMGQMRVRYQAGLPGGEMRDWFSGEDWMKSLKEVAPQTIALTATLGGLGGVAVKTESVIRTLSREVGANTSAFEFYKGKIEVFLNKRIEERKAETERQFPGYTLKEPVAPFVFGGMIEPLEPIKPEALNEQELLAKDLIKPKTKGFGAGRFWQYKDERGIFTVAPNKEEAIKRANEAIEPEISKELEPLAEEAKKYKSAEEFLQNRPNYSIGTGAEKPILTKNGDKIGRLILNENNNEIQIRDIIRDTEEGKGIPTQIVNDLKEYAISKNKQLSLSPIVPGTEKYWEGLGFIKDKTGKYFYNQATKEAKPAIDEEAELSKIYQQQFDEIQSEGKKKIFSDIKELGGIKTDPTLKEEMSDLPIDIIRTAGVIPDEMVDMLNERGYNFESVSDLFDTIRDIRSMPSRFKVAESSMERNLRAVKSIKSKMPKAISEAKILTDLEKEITREITKKRFSIAQMLTQKEKAEIAATKAKFAGIQKGLREGKITTKREIKAIQTELLSILDRSDLELSDKAKFRKAIKNVQTREQLSKFLPVFTERIESLKESALKRTIQSQIDKELKYTKPIKQGQRRVGKYDYESNKIFESLREYNKYTQDKAINELSNIPADNLSELDKIKSRFLSYKANGAKSSVTLQEQVLADINELKRIGEESKDEADFNKKLERQELVEEVLTAISEQKKSRIVLKGAKSIYVSSIANLYSTLNAIAGKNIADKYDYGFLQTNSQYAFDGKIEQAKNKAKEIYGIKKDGELNKIFLNDLVPTDFEITGEDGFTEKISKFDLMNIYNGLENDLIKERYDNYFGEVQVNALLQNLTVEDMMLADYLMEEVQGYKEVLNERNIELFGRDLGNIENYWPSKSEFQQEFFDDIRIQGEIPSAMRERSKSSKVIPQMSNAWLIYQRHIAQAEHIKNLSSRYEELKRLFSDRRVKKTIQEKYGEKTYDALISHIETFSLNKRTELLDAFSGAYSFVLNNWVKAKVASPTVFARQIISSVYSVEQVGIKNFIKYQSEFVANPSKAFKFMWENVPFIKARFKKGYSEALQDVLRGTNNLNIKTGSIAKYTTIASRGGDITGVILNGYPIIKTEMAKHGNMQKAIETFQKFTEKTQQSPTEANRSQLQRNKSALAKTFFRFKNTLNQMLRLQVDANIQFINKQISALQFAEKTFLYSIYTPMMYILMGYMITQGFKSLFGKEDEEETESLLGDIMQQIIIQPFQALPLLDATTETAYSEIRKRVTGKDYYYGESLFSYPLLDDVSTAFSKLTKKEHTAEDWLRVISLSQEPITGIPTETLLRYIRYATGEKSSKVPPGMKSEGMEMPSLKFPSMKGMPSLKFPKMK